MPMARRELTFRVFVSSTFSDLKEERYALEKRGLHFIDPCPLVSPKEVPPPKELENLHFNDRWIFYEEAG